jgi:hypothetical protein
MKAKANVKVGRTAPEGVEPMKNEQTKKRRHHPVVPARKAVEGRITQRLTRHALSHSRPHCLPRSGVPMGQSQLEWGTRG